jgi:hypothetical protein
MTSTARVHVDVEEITGPRLDAATAREAGNALRAHLETVLDSGDAGPLHVAGFSHEDLAAAIGHAVGRQLGTGDE